MFEAAESVTTLGNCLHVGVSLLFVGSNVPILFIHSLPREFINHSVPRLFIYRIVRRGISE